MIYWLADFWIYKKLKTNDSILTPILINLSPLFYPDKLFHSYRKNIISILKFAKPFKRTIFIIGVMIVIVAVAKQMNPWISKIVSDYVQLTLEGKLTVDQTIERILLIIYQV